MVTERVDVPVPSPVQPLCVEPAAVGVESLAVAFRMIDAPSAKLAAHVPVVAPFAMMQLMPAGLLVTVPTPAPVPETVSVRVDVIEIVAEDNVFAVLLHPPLA